MGNNDDESAWNYAIDDEEASNIAELTSSPFSSNPLIPSPLMFSFLLFCALLLFVAYLVLPRGVRFHYFRHRGKRYRWSSSSSRANSATASVAGSAGGYYGNNGAPPYSNPSVVAAQAHVHAQAQQRMNIAREKGQMMLHQQQQRGGPQTGRGGRGQMHDLPDGPNYDDPAFGAGNRAQLTPLSSGTDHLAQNDEIVISAAMQQLRDPGVLIIAHGSKGKPKTVRLQLTETSITWRTETRKRGANGKDKPPPKMGKLHSVPLAHIMYVDVGKQTTALRRVENAGVPEALCFSLLTKEGSLDLEANSARERDALVSCFSLVLDEVHAQNWRDIYRGPSSDMPSSFDDFDENDPGGAGGDPEGRK
mmetsp:Transcript_30153/g.69127  ORF Transcript_30153/g.69127 Transcript_30153/m.69127 type:complete len:363 (-) Transcript_30153:224-1312(-)|eukprot:CAMPEP_0113319838 /NCGR_PEP_ID=MMETSP0010_2-20120614/13878_1 /TAXON_ID=216773 ORGANISM="Corethron hystrix, Strain 308" /NCGR_SAMPLE_ID=MMETSP0010_2 /ASSEMBLY_ACC=CAM_ASM_000155 /LENGTH=362 /DNA_ID=CAMNT_0000177483 /DNA_START=108 /DNA_END=1196 /DNA_ORIENTATION=+ /assembly_acc=CAM_ASM_000155